MRRAPVRAPARRIAAALALLCCTGALLPLLVLAGMATPPAGGCTPVPDSAPLAGDEVPARLAPIYAAAAGRYRLGSLGPAVLAAINSVETDFGRNLSVSSAGAVGWMQFMPATWQTYGVDADGDGNADPYSPADAIHGAARYLRASGAPADWSRAIFAYNHAGWYVDRVLARARRYAGSARGGAPEATPQPAPEAAACGGLDTTQLPGAARQVSFSGRWLAPLPGFPGERCDRRIVGDVLLLVSRYRLAASDCFGLGADRGGPHATGGEHPLGLALDAGPAGGDWDLVDQLARDLGWRRGCAASGCEGTPSLNAALRAIYYTGYPGHGRGDHIHISWKHAPAAPYTPAAWAAIFTAPPAA